MTRRRSPPIVKRDLLGCVSFSTATHHIIAPRDLPSHSGDPPCRGGWNMALREYQDDRRFDRDRFGGDEGLQLRLNCCRPATTNPKSALCLRREADFQGFP
jgi:hypothetical protein